MWSHYADYHRGICLEYSFEEIKKLALFCPIVYTNDFENLINYIDLEKNEVRNGAAKLFVNKSKDWSYEREWRIIVPLSEDGEEKGRILEGLKPQKILTGCRIDDENERRIIKAAEKIHIPLEKMKMDTKKFRVYVDK